MNDTAPRRRWVRPLIVSLVVFAALAAFMSYVFLFRWTDLADALPPEAEHAFTTALVATGGGTPYIEIEEDGTVVIHRELESDAAPGFRTLNVLAWSATDRKLLRLDYPRWFVWMKTSTSFNLGTMIAAVRKDWAHLDLSVTYDDLRRRGPALILDHRRENGSRILIWTAAGGG